MKRILAVLILLASVAGAQIVPENGAINPLQSGISVPGCTISSIVYIDSNGNLACARTPVNGSVSTALRAILTIADSISGSSASSNFLNVTGTIGGTLTADTTAVNIPIATSGTSQQQIFGMKVFLGAGWNAQAVSIAGAFENATSPTGTAASIGVWGNGAGGSASSRVGGIFTLYPTGTTPSAVTTGNVALAADNGLTTLNIYSARDGGTQVKITQDGGSDWSKMSTKALTLGGGAVTFVRVAVTSNSFQGGFIDWCADANDATDYQTRCGILPFSIVNKGGTETCTVGTPGTATESVAASAGTFTVAFTVDTATPTNGCDFLANGTSSLTETVMRINYTVRLVGNAATAVTVQ